MEPMRLMVLPENQLVRESRSRAIQLQRLDDEMVRVGEHVDRLSEG